MTPIFLITLLIISLLSIIAAILLMFTKPKDAGSPLKYGFIAYVFGIGILLQHKYTELVTLITLDPFIWIFLSIASILFSFYIISLHLRIDFIFDHFNNGCKKITWNLLMSKDVTAIDGYQNINIIDGSMDNDTLMFTVLIKHPTHRKFYYNTFDEIIYVLDGELCVNYKSGAKRVLKTGEFVKIDKKEIHEFITLNDVTIKLICIK